MTVIFPSEMHEKPLGWNDVNEMCLLSDLRLPSGSVQL